MAGVASTLLFLFWLTGLVIPPLLPNLPLRQTAADSLGTPLLEPQPATTRASDTKKAPSARMEREVFIGRGR